MESVIFFGTLAVIFFGIIAFLTRDKKEPTK